MCPLKREQARRETQQWVMRRLPTADSIVEIGRKSRSWINCVLFSKWSCRTVHALYGVVHWSMAANVPATPLLRYAVWIYGSLSLHRRSLDHNAWIDKEPSIFPTVHYRSLTPVIVWTSAHFIAVESMLVTC